MQRKKVFIVIPAFNEEKTISKLVSKLKESGYHNVVVISDASEDKTAKKAKNLGAKVLVLPINRGVGGALRTGFEFSLSQGAEIIVMMDADLQHKVSDIKKLIKPIFKNKVDVVLGSRFLTKARVPFLRRLGNIFGNFITYLIYGLKVSDSQSGFRAFRASALEKMELRGNRFEICTEMIGEIKRLGISYKEVPISVSYTKYSLSKGQSLKNGIKTLTRILALKFRR